MAWHIVLAVCALAVRLPAGVSSAAEPAVRVLRDVEYVRRADGALRADIYLPTTPAPHPCVLMIHGGAWLAGVKEHTAWHSRQLAAAGLAAVAIDYRLAPMHRFPAQLDDCRAALVWLAEQADRYELDSDRLAVCGYSAGGHLACLLATTVMSDQRPSVELSAVVAGGAPCEFREEPPASRRLAFWLGGSRAEQPEAYAAASPARFVTAQCPPVFLYHGEVDRLVPVAQPRVLLDELHDVGVSAELHVVRRVGHIGAYWDDAAFQRVIEFLQTQLSVSTESSGETTR
ncbi:MAG: alpha/beta hydrolase [Planctomycetales bacterium]|nr:alpha/beta hydrolase [Planctomycetales bacterium]